LYYQLASDEGREAVEAARKPRRRIRDAPQTGCVLKTNTCSICTVFGTNKQKWSEHGVWSLLLPATAV